MIEKYLLPLLVLVLLASCSEVQKVDSSDW